MILAQELVFVGLHRKHRDTRSELAHEIYKVGQPDSSRILRGRRHMCLQEESQPIPKQLCSAHSLVVPVGLSSCNLVSMSLVARRAGFDSYPRR